MMIKRGPLSREAGALVMLVAGTVATAGSVVLVARSDVLTHPHANAVARGLAIALCTAVGAYTWWQRPRSRLGLLVTGIGLSLSVTALMAVDAPVPFTLGRVATAGFVLLTVYVFICFPRDHLTPGPAASFVRALVILTTALWVLALALTEELPVGGPVAQCTGACPANAFQLVSTTEAVSQALAIAVNALSALGLVVATGTLVAKARSPDRLRRRAVEPLLWVMSCAVLSYAVYLALRQAGVQGSEAPGAIAIAGFLAMPIGILIGQIRGRLFAATSLARMVAATGSIPVTPERVERLIADALGDPTVTLLLWSPQGECYLDVRGVPVAGTGDAVERTVVPVSLDGRRVAAVVHDPGLDQAQEMTEGIAATALMLLDNTRLVEELRASRARIAETAQGERARLERDLHDGAQQRLMAIQIKLSLIREAVDAREREHAARRARRRRTTAVEELRALAHGIYPPVLRDRGLVDALRSAALRSPTAVSVRCRGTDRYPAATEAAVYFSVLEAMQNALKHSAGRRATGSVRRLRRERRVVRRGRRRDGLRRRGSRDGARAHQHARPDGRRRRGPYRQLPPRERHHRLRPGTGAPERRTMMVRVVVAEDSLLAREGVMRVLERADDIEIVATCSDARNATPTIEEARPDVVLTDIRMPPSDTDEGIRIAEELRTSHPEIGVVVLSHHVDPMYAVALFGAGSDRRAYLLKERLKDRGELGRAIRVVASGGSVVDARVVEELLGAQRPPGSAKLSTLTPRERQILGLIAEGHSNGAIADALVVTKRAVEHHVNQIFSKLDLGDEKDVSRRVKAAVVFLTEDRG